MGITTAQIRGARGILNWSQADLAARTGISSTSIGSIENGQSTPRASTLHTIQRAFEDAGIEFIGQEGVKQKSGDVRVLTGRGGFFELFDDIRRAVAEGLSDLAICNADERKLAQWHDTAFADYHKALAAAARLEVRILSQENDTYFPAESYAQYRWLPKKAGQASGTSFIVYGGTLAVLMLDAEPVIVLMNYPAVADSYRRQFDVLWEAAIIPPDLADNDNLYRVAA